MENAAAHGQHVVLVAAGQKAAETPEKAVRSISFKSHQALFLRHRKCPQLRSLHTLDRQRAAATAISSLVYQRGLVLVYAYARAVTTAVTLDLRVR